MSKQQSRQIIPRELAIPEKYARRPNNASEGYIAIRSNGTFYVFDMYEGCDPLRNHYSFLEIFEIEGNGECYL